MGSFLKSAESTHAEVQYNIGTLYQLGYGVDIDYKVAFSWYLKAAEQEYLKAQYNVGFLYYSGEGVDVNYSVVLS